MGNLKVYPSKLKGEVKVPPSKSITHRAIICAALSNGSCKIDNIDYSDDIIATIDAMESLGAIIEKNDNYINVIGIYSNIKNISKHRVIDCNESGSTLRFLIPISLLFEGSSNFIGRGNLGKRPLSTYYKIFEEQKIKYSYEENKLNLLLNGKLKSGVFEVEGNISSQFITGLLFALPLLDKDSKIIITSDLESKAYVDLTLKVMEMFQVEVINNEYKEFLIKGNQTYKPIDYYIEGDYSQAAFYLCANTLGNEVICNDLNEKSLQGDREVIDILKKLKYNLNNNVIDGSQCPDIIPIVTLVASLTEGKTEIINVKRLRIKECDRLSAIATEHNKLGANIIEKEDGLIIEGVKALQGGVDVWSHKDHRIAMTLGIASTICNESIVIKDYECISKSYPKYFEDFEKLGGKIHEWNMGE